MSDDKRYRLSPDNKTSTFGKLLSRIATARFHTRQLAELELWKRQGLGNPQHRAGYKMEEVKAVQRDGTEIIEYRLYKLIDRAIITITSEVSTTTEFGTDATAQEMEDGQKSTD
jgi:hypothetical protein